MVFRRNGRPTFYLPVPTRTGWVQRSAGTLDRGTARAVERMLDALGPKGLRAWDLLDAVLEDRLSIGRLFDAYRLNTLDQLRAELADVDLTAHIEGWQGWLSDRVGASTRERYSAHIRALMPDGQPFWRSRFTAAVVAQWLATRTALVQKRRRSLHGSRRREDAPPPSITGGTPRKNFRAGAPLP